MKNFIKAPVIFVVAALFFAGCSLQEPDKTITAFSAGDASFASYVALGNSLTAGYQSGALTERHQQFSFPALIARQAEVETFNQPLLGYPGIGVYTTQGAGIAELVSLFNAQGQVDPVIQPVPYASVGYNPGNPYASPAVAALGQPYNNLGVPGSVLADLNIATSSGNAPSGSAFFDIILRNPNLGNTTVVQQAQLLQPTFITLWIGNNDVLGYATSGGTSPAAPTDATVFGQLYAQLLDVLLATPTNPQIVVANIPDVTAIPFFTTIPGVVVNPETNEPVLQDGNVIPLIGVNPATDLVTLQAASALEAGFGIPQSLGGTGQPLPDAVVLDADEIATAQTAVTAFNNTIASLAADRNIAVVDINGFFNMIAAGGLELSGQDFTNEFITGGLFSLDGVHPSDVGHAIVANEFIKVINAKYNATVPFVNVIELMDTVSPATSMGKITWRNVDPAVFENVVNLTGGKLQ